MFDDDGDGEYEDDDHIQRCDKQEISYSIQISNEGTFKRTSRLQMGTNEYDTCNRDTCYQSIWYMQYRYLFSALVVGGPDDYEDEKDDEDDKDDKSDKVLMTMMMLEVW